MTDRTRRCCRRTRIYRPRTHALLPLTAPQTPPGEHHGRIHPHAPAIRLDATGAFCLCGDSEFRRMDAHKVVPVILEIGILF
jgi:hypothetical protein